MLFTSGIWQARNGSFKPASRKILIPTFYPQSEERTTAWFQTCKQENPHSNLDDVIHIWNMAGQEGQFQTCKQENPHSNFLPAKRRKDHSMVSNLQAGKSSFQQTHY